MAIIVTCPGCRKSFTVRDEFGGRTGPCPKCKTPIKIPLASQTVKVHGGESFSDGGRSTSGELVLKPIKRTDAVFNPTLATGISVGSVCLLALTWLLRSVIQNSTLFAAGALLVLSPMLACAPYPFLRNQEDLAPLKGKSLYLRSFLCGICYSLLVCGYYATMTYVGVGENIWIGIMLGVPFFVVGLLLGIAFFNLPWSDALIHFIFFIGVVIILRMVAGMPFFPDMNPASSGTLPPPPPPAP